MSARPHPHPRGLRGGHHHHHQGGGYGHHGGGQRMHRGGGHGNRMDYHRPQNHGGGRPPRPGMRSSDPEKLLASLGPDAQLALTTAIINTVLKTSEEQEGPRNFRDNREQNYRNRDHQRREGRGGYYREEMRPRRPYGEPPRRYDSRSHMEEGRGHHFEREKGNAGPPRHQYTNRYPHGPPKRRPSPQMHPGPAYKRPRMERFHGKEGDRMSHRDDFLDDEGIEDMERPRDRIRRTTDLKDERDRHALDDVIDGKSGPSGVQVTIRADGERAVNSDGHVRRVAGRLFVELRCPHCPNQKSITFKEYKMHLTSDYHKSRLHRLARKHTIVLRKIRGQQRQEQRDIENKWKEDKPDEFENSVSRFCNTCKLAFKCLSNSASEGISQHNRSKLHRMQRHYLHPRCGLCRITFPTRMEYERHVASINHLRVRTATIDNQGSSKQTDDQAQDEDAGDLDLANFMTLDSVGEDDEEGGAGSEHEEITGGVDAAEAPDKEIGGDEDDLESISEPSIADKSPTARKERESLSLKRDPLEDAEEELEEDMLENEWDKEQHEDEEEEEHKPLGTEYVRRIEAYYCSICYKVIRADSSLGSRAVQRHCRSFSHLSHYRDHHPNIKEEEGQSGEDGEGEGDLVEEPDQDKFWEEVDKGLTALHGELTTDTETADGIEEKDAAKPKKEEPEKEKEVKANGNHNNNDDADEEEEEDLPEEDVEANHDDSKNTEDAEDCEEVGEDYSV